MHMNARLLVPASRVGLRIASHVATVAALLMAVRCQNPLAEFPSTAVRIAPPAQFVAWWRLAESCSGLTGDLSAVRWYVLPGANSFPLEGGSVNGAWYPDGNRIVLGDSGLSEGSLVRHEMLHALLQRGGHPRRQFLGNCSDIVSCVDRCVTDAGGPPDTTDTAPLIGGDSLIAGLAVVPSTLAVHSDSGWVTVTLSATNRLPIPARVRVPILDGHPVMTAGYAVHPGVGWSGENYYQSNAYVTLAPAGMAGSTRRIVFDSRFASPATATQQQLITGSFSNYVAPPVAVTVSP